MDRDKFTVVKAEIIARQPMPLQLKLTFADGVEVFSDITVTAAEELRASITRAFGD